MGTTKKIGKPPVHPGKILLEGYMKERNIGISEMGEALGVSRNQISGIVNGRKGITTQTAIKLADVTGSTAQLWLNLQNRYDIWHQSKAMTKNARKRLTRFHREFEQRCAG